MAWAHLLNAHQLRLSHLRPTDSDYTRGTKVAVSKIYIL